MKWIASSSHECATPCQNQNPPPPEKNNARAHFWGQDLKTPVFYVVFLVVFLKRLSKKQAEFLEKKRLGFPL
jgi:hypothetical protein